MDERDEPVTEHSIASVLRELAAKGFTGAVAVDAEDGSTHLGDLWLAGGRLYLTLTPNGDDLADVVFGANVGTLAEVRAALEDPSVDLTARISEDLPESVSILGRLLHEHNLTGLFEIMVSGSATFATEPGAMHALGPRFAESVDDLLNQAERRLSIWKEIAARIPSTQSRFRLAPELPESVEERVVTADEWRYLALIGTGSSVGDLIDATGEGAFRIMTSLYRLILEDVVVDA